MSEKCPVCSRDVEGVGVGMYMFHRHHEAVPTAVDRIAALDARVAVLEAEVRDLKRTSVSWRSTTGK